MRSVSSAFDAAVRKSHQLRVEAIVTTTTGESITVPVLDGSITLDQTAAVRGRCDVTLPQTVRVEEVDVDLVPRTPADMLAPYGNEIVLRRGLVYVNGFAEYVSLGVFRIQEADVDDTPAGLQIRVTGLDRAQRIADARFEEPFNLAASTNVADAILAVVQAAWPGVPFDFTGTGHVTAAAVAQEGDDRWAFVQEMATSIAMRLYFDGDGVLRLVPDVLSSPVATLAEGDDGVLVTASRRWTRESAFNRVIATGENTNEDAPVRGVATDESPLSPTYYFGPFGKVPRFYSSPFLTTDDQCASAALSLLQRELGTTEQVGFGSFVLPHLEPGDTVTITRERSGIDEDHVLDAITIPLSAAGTMTGQTRARQVT